LLGSEAVWNIAMGVKLLSAPASDKARLREETNKLMSVPYKWMRICYVERYGPGYAQMP
jgi:hypothetical protein